MKTRKISYNVKSVIIMLIFYAAKKKVKTIKKSVMESIYERGHLLK